MTTRDKIDLGPFGIWTFDFEWLSASQLRDTAQQLEEQGWPAVWVPELFGREAMSHAAFLLSVTEEMQVVNGIAQIWSRGARWAQAAAVLLADAYPGRHVLGLGFGGDRKPGVRPIDAMVDYLDEMDGRELPAPTPPSAPRRLLAAFGPQMLALARERTGGAHTYKVNVAHTARAREILGSGAFLGVEHAVLFETDAERARTIAREHLAPYLAGAFNVAKFKRLGYSDDDLAGGGSDRFVDDFVFWGHEDAIVAKLRAHHEAGADHVAIQVIGATQPANAMPYWRSLAEAVLT